MDIEAEVLRKSALENAEHKELGLKSLFVAPSGMGLPKDGTLEYATVSSVYDFKAYAEGTVVMVDTEQIDILKCVVDNNVLFGVALRVLTGIPESEASIEFDHATWKLEQVAYAPLISELSLQREVSAQAERANESKHDRERRQFTRADGSVKAQSQFDLADKVPLTGNDDAEDPDDHA